MLFHRLHVRKHERALVFQRGDFAALPGPGTYVRNRVLDAISGRKVEIVSTLVPRFTHPLLAMIAKEPALVAVLHVVDLKDSERALVWKDGRFDGILGP